MDSGGLVRESAIWRIGCGDHRSFDADLVQDKGVGRFDLDVPGLEAGGREVFQIAGDDHLGAGFDRGGQHVSVSGVR
jgi:hypothetical protein